MTSWYLPPVLLVIRCMQQDPCRTPWMLLTLQIAIMNEDKGLELV